MTRTTPELAPPLQASTPHQRESVWPLRMIWCATGPIHGGSSVESGFEPAALRSGGRDLASSPPRPRIEFGFAWNFQFFRSLNEVPFPVLAPSLLLLQLSIEELSDPFGNHASGDILEADDRTAVLNASHVVMASFNGFPYGDLTADVNLLVVTDGMK
ncbi:hypothetical protein AVEN_103031-1 [Araneus ventricosus]|uniref:Uncharacterized protein n=1 Tax=Araneus ventricosus TaxID=182803 RepID=A0A4Y2BAM0_ARAVE|nr:hypothetical protein AVEN_103031-1 [Araneus ventricosus]